MGRGPWIPPGRVDREIQPPLKKEGFDENNKKLSVEERQSLRMEVEEKKAILENRDEGDFVSTSAGQSLVARDQMARDLRRKELLLQKDEELTARGAEKDRIYRRIKDLEAKLRPYMPSENEMWAKMGTQDSDNAVKKNLYFQKTFIRELLELKDLRRRLEADDPGAGNLEKMRPR